MECCRELYLNLVKNSLQNLIYGDCEVVYAAPEGVIKRAVFNAIKAQGLEIVRRKPFDPEVRKSGRDWPTDGQTMLSMARLENVEFCIRRVLEDGIEGNLIEAGVWRGGASILMRAVLAAYGVTDRTVFVADSFEGLPKANSKDYPADAGIDYYSMEVLRVSLEQVQANFAKYGLLDDQVRFLKGWFSETLPKSNTGSLAVVRLDGDMYESTMDGLVSLYPRLNPGGYIILDDYVMLEPCRKAVDDYRSTHGITDPIEEIDFAGAFWRKSG